MANDTKTDRFKLPGSSLDEVFKVVQGYASLGRAGSLSDIAKNTGMHETSISKNVGFLISLDVLEGGRNKSTTPKGAKLGLALMHNVPEEVQSILADIVSSNDFLKNVLAAVRIRKGMDDSALRSHIAYSAGMSKTGSTVTGAGAVIELLKRSGQLALEDGKLVVSSPPASVSATEETSAPMSKPTHGSAAIGRSVLQTIHSEPPFTVTIQINVNCGPDDLADLGDKLRKVLKDFSDERDDATEEQ